MNSFPYTLRIITSITYILYLFRIHPSIPSLLYGSYMNTKVKSNLSLAQLFIPIFLLPLQAPLSVAILPHISHSYNFEYTPHPKGTVLRRRLRWAAWRYSTGKEASLALPLLLIAQHLYIRGISAAY